MLRALACSFSLLIASAPGVRADFQLRDGDTVVFLGDSITAEGTFGKVIENYTLLRYPERKVRFYNAGIGGDTAQRSLARVDRDVLDLGATVVIVALGVNDIGWGTKPDEEHQKAYLDGLRGIIEHCQGRHARVFVVSAAITNETNDRGEAEPLQAMCDRGMALARDMGEQSIDAQRVMRRIHRDVRRAGEGKKPEDRPTMHKPDGVHLSELGGVAMGFAILKGLGAPADVSAVTLDAEAPDRVEASGCRVGQVAKEGDRLSFDRLDEGYPLNFGFLAGLRFGYVPIGDELNRYLLTVRNLPPGQYDVTAGGRALGHWSSEALAKGVNLASATASGFEPGGPWEAKAWALNRLTDGRLDAIEAYRALRQYLPDAPGTAEAIRQFVATDERLIADQRAIAHPLSIRFVITPHDAE